MNQIILVLLLLALTSCAQSKPSEADKNITAGSVGVLFTVDGITVYRFGDSNRYHYFAVQTGRPNTVTLSDWTESCGKNCRKEIHESIHTLVAR